MRRPDASALYLDQMGDLPVAPLFLLHEGVKLVTKFMG